MTAATTATTIQNRGGVASASRNANSATEFGSGLRANHSSLMNGCGSICMRAASGTTPSVKTTFMTRNPANSAANSVPMCTMIQRESLRALVSGRSSSAAANGTTANSALV